VDQRLGERVGGYKVGFSPEGGIFCAPIYASKVHASPARLPARGFHLITREVRRGDKALTVEIENKGQKPSTK